MATTNSVHTNTKFKSDAVFEYLSAALKSLREQDRLKLLEQISGVFEFVVRNNERKTQKYTLDLKKDGLALKSTGLEPLNNESSPDVIMYICDGDLVDLVKGRLNGQRAFMLGKLKIKGRMDLAIRLDSIFKQLVSGKSKL